MRRQHENLLFSGIADNLVMGRGPLGRPLHLPGAFVAVLDIKPSSSFIYWDDTEIREVQMDDSWYQPLGGVDELARWVNEKRKEGTVLVKCEMGLNRSGVVVARALMLDGTTAQEAIDLIRERRGRLALSNQYFEEWLLARDITRLLDADTSPRSHSQTFYEPYSLASGETIGPPSDYEQAAYEALIEETERLIGVQDQPLSEAALAYTRCGVRFVRAKRI